MSLVQGGQLTALPPLSLYVHFPWCLRKCPYCDFNSHAVGDRVPETRYLAALRADLESCLPLVWGRRVHTIFIGGGTPSLLSVEGVEQLLSDVRARIPLEADAEITLEANPGTFEVEKFRAYRSSGINRLSIGIQSFNERHLKALGRVHDAAQARYAIEIAQETFDNFNLDLMYALPGQALAELEADLGIALSYAPQHLSYYNLTLEPNTLFARRPPELPDEEVSADMAELIEARTHAAGYGHYEVSAYSQPNRQCRHNRNYWEFGDYLGIGAGAHAKISFPDRIVRQTRYKHPAEYLRRSEAGGATEQGIVLERSALPFEFMLNALRMREGVPTRFFAERTGLRLDAIEPALQAAESKGLLSIDLERMQPTALGWRFLNDLQQMFL